MSYPQTLSLCHRRIADLENRIEELRAQVEYGGTDDADLQAFKLGLSGRQTDLFKMLRGQKMVSRLDLLDEFGSKSYLSVILCKTRKKLAKQGLQIINCHSVGYRLEGVTNAN